MATKSEEVHLPLETNFATRQELIDDRKASGWRFTNVRTEIVLIFTREEPDPPAEKSQKTSWTQSSEDMNDSE